MVKYLILAALSLTVLTASAGNIAQSLCDYTNADDKKRMRAFLKTNKLKVRSVYKGVTCNGKTLLGFADKRGSLMVGEFLISKLPKKVVEAEMVNLDNHHLVEAAKNRVE